MTSVTRPGRTALPRRVEAIDVGVTRWLAWYGILITRLGRSPEPLRSPRRGSRGILER